MPAYRLDVASTGRASCNGRQPCKGTTIPKGALRLGAWVTIQDKGSFRWRHWHCTTPQVIGNLKGEFTEASELDGYEELPPNYQEMVDRAWDLGRIPEEDVPEDALLPPAPKEKEDGETDGNPSSSPVKKRKAPPKNHKADEIHHEGEEDKKPKPQPKQKKQAKASKPSDDEGPVQKPTRSGRRASKVNYQEIDEDVDEEEVVKPAAKKPRTSKAKAKQESESEAEPEINDDGQDEEEQEDGSEEDEKPIVTKYKAQKAVKPVTTAKKTNVKASVKPKEASYGRRAHQSKEVVEDSDSDEN